MKDQAFRDLALSPELRQKLLALGSLRVVKENDFLLQESDNIRSIPIVLQGNIRVMRTDEDGREMLLYYIRPGESCIMSFLGGLHQDTSKIKAVAEEDTEILFIPIEHISLLIAEFPEWLDYIFKLYHKRFEELLEVINAISFKKLDDRLLSYLQNKSDLTQNQTLAITHEQLASELGSARVVVSRLLKQMEDKGLVALGRNKITLL